MTVKFSHESGTVSMIDAEDLIAHLSGGLAPPDRVAFRRAAENAMATSPQCSGEGAAYRIIAQLWRKYCPPADTSDNSWYQGSVDARYSGAGKHPRDHGGATMNDSNIEAKAFSLQEAPHQQKKT
jgi:hypothetical protein